MVFGIRRPSLRENRSKSRKLHNLRQHRKCSVTPTSVVGDRVASVRCRAEQMDPVHATRRQADQRTGQRHPPALTHRARRPGLQAGLRAGSRRGPRLARVHHHSSLSIATYGLLMACTRSSASTGRVMQRHRCSSAWRSSAEAQDPWRDGCTHLVMSPLGSNACLGSRGDLRAALRPGG